MVLVSFKRDEWNAALQAMEYELTDRTPEELEGRFAPLVRALDKMYHHK